MGFAKTLEMYKLYFNEASFGQPYCSNDEYISDITALMDMYVEIALGLRKQNQLKIKNKTLVHAFSFRGIVITDEEVDNIVEGSHISNRNAQKDKKTAESLLQAWSHIESRAAATKEICLPMQEFFAKFKFSIFEKLSVIAALCVEIDRKYERIFSYIQDDNNAKMPTFGLALAFATLTGPTNNHEIYSVINYPLLGLLFVNVATDFNQAIFAMELSLRRRIVSIFVGKVEEDLFVRRFGQSFYPGDELENLVVAQQFNKELTSTVKKALKAGGSPLIHIYGEEGAGKRLQVKHLANNFGRPVIFADLSYFMSVGVERALYFSETLAVEGVINNKIICLYNVDVTDEDMGNLSLVLDELRVYGNLVFVLNKSPKFPISKRFRHESTLDIEVKPLGMRDSLKIWEALAKPYEVEDGVDFKLIANKFNYTPGQIKKILAKASLTSEAEGNQVKKNALVEVCRGFSVHNLERKATLINCKYTFDDLVIDESQKAILMSACNYIKYKDVVYEQWDFASKVAYGRGLSVIFYGPPGTGKTMGAQVMANELGLQLYKVDVSQIMNKYIGETEKNLNDIFDEAKTSNAILLFDEADSLFGKRTDVKNSNDKFSNNEISFLLQKMEEYNGVSILTTNKFNNFDDAFRRRIKFMVNFPAPSPEMRKLLWQKIFPKDVPLSSEFDPELLAERFDLTGSSIKSIALQAAYSAAAAGGVITMEQILEAIKYEYQKLGKISSDNEFSLI